MRYSSIADFESNAKLGVRGNTMSSTSNINPMQQYAKYSDKSKKPFWNRQSLNRQLIGFAILIVLTVVVAITASTIVRENEIFRGELEQQALTLLDATEASMQDSLYFADIDTIDNLASSLADTNSVLVFRVYDTNGRILAAPGASELEGRIDADPFGAELVARDGNILQWESDRLIAGQQFFIGNQLLGAAHVELSTESFNIELQASITRGVVTAILATVFAVFLSILLSRSITRPITNLVAAADQIATGNLDQRISIEGSSVEVDKLSESVENMRLNLQAVYQNLEDRIAQRTEELQKSRDEAVEARKIADENSRLKSEFLSMMSHELRTPMNAIEGFTGIILNRMAGTDYNDKTERYLQKVKSNSQRLLGLINDFLDLSRIESGRLELAHSPMQPKTMVQSWHDNLSVLAENKGIEFTATSDPELPETLYGDEESLSKIAINLVGNAIKFTEEGKVTLKLEKADDQMKLEVQDTGIGIPPHAREFVFDEFRQVDMSSKRQHGGTGLGLSIVNKLAQAMGGTVTLQSEVGEGSTFTVLIPISTEPETS